MSFPSKRHAPKGKAAAKPEVSAGDKALEPELNLLKRLATLSISKRLIKSSGG